MTRRWKPWWTGRVSGVQFRIVPGRKEDGDLRLEVLAGRAWQPVHMAMAALLTDFFVENEEHLRQFRPHWQQTGRAFFLAFLADAVTRGWEAASADLQAQRTVKTVPHGLSAADQAEIDALVF